MRPELLQAVQLLQQNTPEAVEQAIALLQKTVYSFSLKVCGHPEDAEDTMQEVLYRSIEPLRKLQEPAALAVWLYTVTRNRCWRMRRKDFRNPSIPLDALMPDDAELSRLLADHTQSPERSVLQLEQAEQLRQAVLALPPTLRIVVVLHDMEDLSTEQVAAILSLQPGTVRVRLHRGRLALRKLLAGHPIAPPAAAPPVRPAACRALFARLSDYLDQHLEARTCEQMRSHIDACPACVAFLGDLTRAIDRLRLSPSADAPALAQRLRQHLTAEYLRLLSHDAEVAP